MENTTKIADLPESHTISASSASYLGEHSPGVSGSGAMSPYQKQTQIPQPPPQQQQQQYPPQQRLPSRDIKFEQTDYMQDPHMQANYIPHNPNSASLQSHNDYIDENVGVELPSSLSNGKKEKKKKKVVHFSDEWFEILKLPVAVGLVFFVFQLPIFEKLLKQYLTFTAIYNEDKSFNMYGYMVKSVLFGLTFYIMSEQVRNFSI